MITEQPDTPDDEYIRKVLRVLMEHFDSAHIFVTRFNPNDNDTTSIALGAGNIYAREGQIKGWVIKMDEETKAHARKQLEE